MTTAIGSNHHPSHIRESRGDRVFQYAIIALSVVLLVIVAYPLYFTVIASFSKPEDVMLGRVVFWPRSFSVESYKMVIAEKSIWMGYGNTIIYTVLGTALNLLLTIMIAYPLSWAIAAAGLIVCFLLLRKKLLEPISADAYTG